jgi:hypothetical protein
MTRLFARLLALTLTAGLLLVPAVVAQAKPLAPKVTAPKANATVSTMPALTWNKAKGASSYELQISSDAGFNPALVTTKTANLRYVNSTMLPNGAYFWRVRSLDAASGTSKWSKVRKFTKKWNATAVILTPAALASIAYPNPTILTWTPVPGAVTYKVAVASGASGGGVDAPGGIISNGALAWSDGGKPIETSNTNLAVSTALHPGTYYWQVIPVDAQGHNGTPSAIFSFAWIWAGTTTPNVTDLVPGIEIYDPLFSWPAIPGAASYELEVNLTSGFALGSRLMLSTTTATSFAPKQTLPNNTYYWRVRGVDPQGQAGPWNNGPAFTKTYDLTVLDGPANLRVLDTQGTQIAFNGHVDEPVIAWNTVPGARSYQVQLNCSGTIKVYTTANTSWTPLAPDPPLNGVPFLLTRSPGAGVNYDDPPTNSPGGSCLVSVQAFADNAIDGTAIAGLYAQTRFQVGGQTGFDNPPAVDCDSACAGLLDDFDIAKPLRGTITGKSPLFCWTPADLDDNLDTVPGNGDGTEASTHYWVTIARDPQFTTSVEQAYTSAPCYAPSKPMVDEGTLYYWQVIPADDNGNGYDFTIEGSGGFVSSPSFQHVSVPPAPAAPVGGAAVPGAVTFRWAPVPEQVRNYTIEIAQDDSFSTILESATTDATAYSANAIFPVGATTYWRVRANNDESKGLAWSGTSSFVQTLPAPTITTATPFEGATFPALTWTPVDGASTYEVQDVWPDASVHVTSNIPSAAVSYNKMTGTGHGTVQVRAVFPNGLRSAYTPTRDVVHTISAPGGSKTQLINKPGKLALTFAWNTKTNAKQYKVQVSRNPGFSETFLDTNTDQSSYTPLLTEQDFIDGGVMYWRVAVIDPDGNTGAFSKAKKFTILARMQVQITGVPVKGSGGVATVSVLNAKGKPIKGAAVKLQGAGVKTKTKKTNKKGVVDFTIKPKRLGNLTAIATKKLFKVGSLVVQVT